MIDEKSALSLAVYLQAALGRKAKDLTLLDVSQLTSVADVFVICTGKSNRQVSAIAEHIVTDLKSRGIKPLSMEGLREGLWVLLDYGHIVIHVFYEPVRGVYDLEGLWSDAGRISINDIVDTSKYGYETDAKE
ncbi:MAG: ribosome silencing factor [Desulfobacterales bacterium]|jgi:ribosome-associated protein|nr:ribosome silencing factor [Desulfobacterales bacterium]